MRGRVPALDALRGVAALVVLVHHELLLVPSFADALLPGRTGPVSPTVWAFTYSPLHLVWAGGEAVIVFFVLSGYVLTRGMEGAGPGGWGAYYVRRALRLYLPVWAAVGLACVWIVLVPRQVAAGRSWWVNAHEAPDLGRVVDDLVLLGDPGATNSALWSLRWEVYFSLALPVVAVCVYASRRFGSALLVAVLAVISLPGPYPDTRYYVGAFLAGAFLCVAGRSGTRPWAGVPAWVVAVLLLTSRWTFGASTYTSAAVVLGAVALVLLVQSNESVLSGSWLRWAGSRSFSLYLVHEPIVVSAGLLDVPRAVQICGSAVLALAAADLFHRLVEAPAVRLARRTAGAATPERAPVTG